MKKHNDKSYTVLTVAVYIATRQELKEVTTNNEETR